MPNAAAIESAQLEPMVRNSPVGAASALVGGGIMVTAVAYEDGFLSLGLARWCGLLAVTYAGQVGLAFVLRRRAHSGLNTRTGLALFTAIGLVEGVVWSIGIVGVSARRPIEQELTVLSIGAGVAAGAALSFGFHMPNLPVPVPGRGHSLMASGRSFGAMGSICCWRLPCSSTRFRASS